MREGRDLFMNSWVAPTLAAELWGTTVDDILQRIVSGQLETREMGGFLFVDANAPRLRADERPATYRDADELALSAALEAEDDKPLNFRAARTRIARVAPRVAA
jgi:hypothetical protein